MADLENTESSPTSSGTEVPPEHSQEPKFTLKELMELQALHHDELKKDLDVVRAVNRSIAQVTEADLKPEYLRAALSLRKPEAIEEIKEILKEAKDGRPGPTARNDLNRVVSLSQPQGF
jgi:hypothetical protein